MQLTRQTDYGLRTLIYLALHPGERIPAARIATVFGVSQNHLMKVIGKLSAAGLIETRRGNGGGIALIGLPEAIRVGSVVRILEEELELTNCTRPLCPILPSCRLKSALSQARDAFLAVLDDCSLADLVRQRGGRLRALLAAPKPAPESVS